MDNVLLFGALAVCGIAGGLIADTKQRSVRGWSFASFLCPLPALVIVCALQPKRRAR